MDAGALAALAGAIADGVLLLDPAAEGQTLSPTEQLFMGLCCLQQTSATTLGACFLRPS